jgi:transporter family protein
MLSHSNSWFFWALLSAVCAALTAIFAKVGIRNIDSDAATFIRTVIIIMLLALLLSYTEKWKSLRGLPAETLGFLFLSALATGASWLCYFRALQLGTASQVAPVDKLSVVLVAVLAFFFLGERPALKDWCGIGLISAGVLLLAIKR